MWETGIVNLYEGAKPFSEPPAGACQPGLLALRDFLMFMFPGTTNLGCYSNRPVTGTTATPSLHRDGRAIDLGTVNADQAAEVVEFLVRHNVELGMQMVLDYRNHRRWRWPYSSLDTKAGYGYWSKSGGWLHIERSVAGAADPTPVGDLIGLVPPPEPPPLPPSPEPEVEVRETLAQGNRGALVLFVQQVLGVHWPNPLGRPLEVDGIFGPQTAELVRLMQRANKMADSGVVDAPTWRVVDLIANGLTD